MHLKLFTEMRCNDNQLCRKRNNFDELNLGLIFERYCDIGILTEAVPSVLNLDSYPFFFFFFLSFPLSRLKLVKSCGVVCHLCYYEPG